MIEEQIEVKLISLRHHCAPSLIIIHRHRQCFWYCMINTIYVHCRKIYNLFVRALETSGKSILCRPFLSYFASSANNFCIFQQCTYTVFIPEMPKSLKHLHGVLCDLGAYITAVSFRRAT